MGLSQNDYTKSKEAVLFKCRNKVARKSYLKRQQQRIPKTPVKRLKTGWNCFGNNQTTSQAVILLFNRGEVIDITGEKKLDSDEVVKLFISNQAHEEKVVCIGETGFDFFRMTTPKQRQEEWFRFHIETAIDVKKPVIIHSRNSHEETLSVLDTYSITSNDVDYGSL